MDGMPESFIGPLLADLVCHEVGHTMGLRHNFKSSSLYTLEEMNSEALKGQKPFAGSVMDYLPVNFNFENGKIQGDYAMIGVGPYDLWAIEYGYTFDDKKLPDILKRVAEPELIFATDEDTLGSDPLARRYDFSKDPLDFAKTQVKLARYHRDRILEHYVKEGDPWRKARQGYLMTLSMQIRSTSMMANWLGGAHINRDKKGDPNGRKPIEVVDAQKQRDAMNFVIENTFFDEAFGLTPELLQHMVDDSWRDTGNFSLDPVWPVHDQVAGVQASALSQMLNPTTLRRVFDNEFRVAPEEDALTLNEVMTSITDAVWKELGNLPDGKFSDRIPAISSIRRNLQAEHLERLFDLANAQSNSAAMKPISNLASLTLRDLKSQLAEAKDHKNLDNYTRAHLVDLHDRIERWVDAKVVMQNAQTTTILAPVAQPVDK
ncbi:MAG: zinc-dependent metalloprotease [Pirellulaceae bacterium]